MMVTIELMDHEDGTVTYNILYSDYTLRGSPAYLLTQELAELIRTRSPGPAPELWNLQPQGEC